MKKLLVLFLITTVLLLSSCYDNGDKESTSDMQYQLLIQENSSLKAENDELRRSNANLQEEIDRLKNTLSTEENIYKLCRL